MALIQEQVNLLKLSRRRPGQGLAGPRSQFYAGMRQIDDGIVRELAFVTQSALVPGVLRVLTPAVSSGRINETCIDSNKDRIRVTFYSKSLGRTSNDELCAAVPKCQRGKNSTRCRDRRLKAGVVFEAGYSPEHQLIGRCHESA